MRTGKVGDIVVTLNERDYRQLLKRTDTSKVVHQGNQMRTDADCICKAYGTCRNCPLGKLELNGVAKCMSLVREKLGIKYPKFNTSTKGMIWQRKEDAEARVQLDTIHDFLLRIPKTTR